LNALYPTAVGAIPTLVALYAQLNLHREPAPGNRVVTILVALCCPFGFVAAIVAVLHNHDLSDAWRDVVIASIVLPSVFIGITVAVMAVMYPWPVGQLQRLIERGEAPRFDSPRLREMRNEQRLIAICGKLDIDPEHPDATQPRLLPRREDAGSR
jgi:hypothetical protein